MSHHRLRRDRIEFAPAWEKHRGFVEAATAYRRRCWARSKLIGSRRQEELDQIVNELIERDVAFVQAYEHGGPIIDCEVVL